MIDVMQLDDVWVTLTRLEKLDLSTTVNAATNDLHRILDTRLLVTTLPVEENTITFQFTCLQVKGIIPVMYSHI